ncbi:class I SAM-dependent methyltransferase [Taibaiella koreensis]|uniref:class I SAM-dependent methyltransferase n=1 Tax=Taibaiella koreensis TaxID=1268548 RepID=UPI000E5A0A63|nr:class I SAM-dependent methyltransferase [Taibaiella koreensis]
MDKTTIAVQVFDEQARNYQDKYMDQSLYGNTLDLFCSSLPPGKATVLDLACGPGNITRYLLQQRPELQLLGLDLAPAMLELARSNNPGATFAQMDCRDIAGLNDRYHGLVCGFVLPYLDRAEALKLIADAAVLLLPGGIFYLSTIEGPYSSSGLYTSSNGKQVYMHYYEAPDLIPAVEAAGLELLHTQQQSSPGPMGTMDLILVARKV